MKKKQIGYIAKSSIIAALYVVLTMVSAIFGLSSGMIQVRISEALSFLPFLTPAAIPGLTIGCLISNTLAGGVPLDIVFGSIATLLGALASSLMGRFLANSRFNIIFMILSTIPTVISNMLIVPWVLKFAYGAGEAIPFMMLTVGIGEFIACTVIGTLVILSLRNKFNLIK